MLAQLLGHLAADEHVVGAAAEVLQHAELVLHLRAPGDEQERTLDLAEQAAEMLQLCEQQQPRVGGQDLGDADCRCMRAVRGAEGVVDEEVAALGQLPREFGVVLRLPGVEARVLEQLDPLVPEQRAQVLAHRLHPVNRVVPRRPPEMGADADAGGVAVEQQLQRRERGPDARVIGNATVLERDVQVGADEDAFAAHVRVPNGARQPHG